MKVGVVGSTYIRDKGRRAIIGKAEEHGAARAAPARSRHEGGPSVRNRPSRGGPAPTCRGLARALLPSV